MAVLGNRNTQRVSTKMSDVAEEFHGCFSITGFEFGGGGTHAAKILDLAARANGLAFAGRLADFAKWPIPSFREA